MNTSMVTGYAALEKGQQLSLFTYAAPALGENEVRVAISHCGLCYTDIQAIEDYYRITNFPFVPGHEIVGHVTETGKNVSGLKEGDRVGIGWQGRACMQCEWCKNGEVNLCQDIVNTASWTPYGGFSSSIAVDVGFAYPLPEGMPSEVGAVLLCGGISVYRPLRMYSSPARQKVGIIGVGGLGHLAIQFARALGYEVTVISTSPNKKAEALAFGADDFISLGDKAAMLQVAYYFDLLLYTAHGQIDMDAYLEVLRKKGKMILVGFPDIAYRTIDLVAHELSISGSFLGTQAEMGEMLKFAHTHSIQPVIEVMPMAQVNAAIQRLKENKAHYRIVLAN